MVFKLGRVNAQGEERNARNFTFSSILVILGLLLSNTAAQETKDPKLEVVSIYSDSFNYLPTGLSEHFIKVRRCVSFFGCPYYVIPKNTTNITVAVENTMTGEYLKYTIPDHISCICAAKHKRKAEHYKRNVETVGRAQYKKLESNNPPFVRECKPQQRYKESEDGYKPNFYGYMQCLPFRFCKTAENKTVSKTLNKVNGETKTINFTSDTKCKVNLQQPVGVANVNARTGSDDDKFSVDSKKTFFALVLLAVLFLIFIITDLTFCCRKKGFCYSLTKCIQTEEEQPQDRIQATLTWV